MVEYVTTYSTSIILVLLIKLITVSSSPSTALSGLLLPLVVSLALLLGSSLNPYYSAGGSPYSKPLL